APDSLFGGPCLPLQDRRQALPAVTEWTVLLLGGGRRSAPGPHRGPLRPFRIRVLHPIPFRPGSPGRQGPLRLLDRAEHPCDGGLVEETLLAASDGLRAPRDERPPGAPPGRRGGLAGGADAEPVSEPRPYAGLSPRL